jgi:hypothetical protein
MAPASIKHTIIKNNGGSALCQADQHTIIKNNEGFALCQAVAELGCTPLADGPQILTDELSATLHVVLTCSALDLSTPVIAGRVMAPRDRLRARAGST